VNPVLFPNNLLIKPVENIRKGSYMSEILGSVGTSSPINPIRKKELDDNWKTVAAKAVTEESFKKNLAGDPINVLEEHGLKVAEGIKVNFDETNQEYNFNVPPDASEEIMAEAQWWTWRLKMIKEFAKELSRQVGNVAGFDESY
jgi:hypothetical protein